MAARGTLDITRLRHGGTLLGLCPLIHHLLEANITTLGVLVKGLSREDARCVRGVSTEGLKGVEVLGGPGGVGVPSVVHVLLRVVVPKLVVVISELNEESARLDNTGAERGGRGEGRGGGREGDSCECELLLG